MRILVQPAALHMARQILKRPLYPGLTNDLHVSIATSFQQNFPCFLPTQA